MKKRLISVISVLMCITLLFAACSVDKKEAEDTESESSERITQAENVGSDSDEVIDGTDEPERKPSTDKLVAITYDDGPYAPTTGRILDILEENGAKATFFIVGNRIADYPDTVQRIIDMDCEVGSHTYDHEYLNKISASERETQINSFNDEMMNDFGYDTLLLRAPGGHYSGVEDVVGMPLIQWSIDTLDWKFKDAANPDRSEAQREAKIDEIVEEVMTDVESGDIILMHDIYEFTADVSAKLIPRLVEEGYKLVTVSEMFDAYALDLEAGGVYSFADPLASVDADVTVAVGDYTVTTRNGGGLNLRESASTSSNILIEIPNGTTLTVVDAVEGWAKCSYNGHTGWVSSKFLVAVSVG